MKALEELAALREEFGPDAGARKRALLQQAIATRHRSAADVRRLHEALCFSRAYPDDAHLLAQVEDALAGFATRLDVQRFAETLAGSGIAGTPIDYAFYWPTAQWLATRWPSHLSIDWDACDGERLEALLPLFLLYTETPALDTMVESTRNWVARFKRPDETDAVFIVRSLAAQPLPERARETWFDGLDLAMRFAPGDGTPSRSRAKLPTSRIAFQRKARTTARPDVRRAAKVAPRSSRILSPGVGRDVVRLAREAMLTRSRDLDAIAYASADDVRHFDCGRGLAYVSLGVAPERRLLLESVYVFLILKNGVPIGYFQASSLLGCSELNYNIFPPWRGREAAAIYAKGVSVVRHFLGSDTFAVSPYQLGDGNAEAIRSGSFWFYYKLGFRPRDEGVQAILDGELRAMKRNPKHRSSAATLRRMAVEYAYLHLDAPRDDVVGRVPYGNIALAVTRYVRDRFDADRERARRICSRDAARLLGVSPRSWSVDEREAWSRWAPLVMVLPGVASWTPRHRAALAQVIRAKGSRRESDYVRRHNAHALLRRSLAELAWSTS